MRPTVTWQICLNNETKKVISDTNRTDPAKHLNEIQPYLKKYGTIKFTKNFKNLIIKGNNKR